MDAMDVGRSAAKQPQPQGSSFPWGLVELMAIPAVGGGLMAWIGHSPRANINDRVRFVGDLRLAQQELAAATDPSTLEPTIARLQALAARTHDPDSLQVGFRVPRSGIRHGGESLEQATRLIRSGDLAGARQSVSWVNGFMSQGVDAGVVDRYLVDSHEAITHTATFQGTGAEEVRAAGAGFFSRMKSGHLTTGEALTVAGGAFAAFVGGSLIYGAIRDGA
jgi:hypothetical protein